MSNIKEYEKYIKSGDIIFSRLRSNREARKNVPKDAFDEIYKPVHLIRKHNVGYRNTFINPYFGVDNILRNMAYLREKDLLVGDSCSEYIHYERSWKGVVNNSSGYDGMTALDDGMTALDDGMTALDDGMTALDDGMTALESLLESLSQFLDDIF